MGLQFDGPTCWLEQTPIAVRFPIGSSLTFRKKTAPVDIAQSMSHWHLPAATVIDYDRPSFTSERFGHPSGLLEKLGISKGKTTFGHIECLFGLPDAKLAVLIRIGWGSLLTIKRFLIGLFAWIRWHMVGPGISSMGRSPSFLLISQEVSSQPDKSFVR